MVELIKYEYLTDEEILPPDQRRKNKLSFLILFRRYFWKKNEDQGRKQVELLQVLNLVKH